MPRYARVVTEVSGPDERGIISLYTVHVEDDLPDFVSGFDATDMKHTPTVGQVLYFWKEGIADRILAVDNEHGERIWTNKPYRHKLARVVWGEQQSRLVH